MFVIIHHRVILLNQLIQIKNYYYVLQLVELLACVPVKYIFLYLLF